MKEYAHTKRIGAGLRRKWPKIPAANERQ